MLAAILKCVFSLPIGELDYTNGQNGNAGGNIPAPGLHITGPAYFDAVGNPYSSTNQGANIPFDPTNPNHTDDHVPHLLTYQATDDCGNVSELTVNLYVVDNLAPTAVL